MAPKNDYFKTICKVSRAFGTSLEENEILELVVQSAIDTMQAKAACLWLADEEKDKLVPVAQKGLSKKYFQLPLSLAKIKLVIMKEGYIHARDATSDPRLEEHEAKKAEGIASILIVPVMVKGKLIGILSLYTSQASDFSPDEIEFLSALAEQGGMAIKHARLLERVRENTRLFRNLDVSINSSLDVKAIFQTLTADIAKGLRVKASSVLLVNKDNQSLELVASYGLSGQYLDRGPLAVEKSMAETLKGEPVVIKDAASDNRVQYREEKEAEGIVSILSAPIMAKDEVIGALRLYSGVSREFTDDEIMLVTALAHQGGLAIQNASLYMMVQEDMKDLKDDMWSHRSWF